MGRAYKLWSEEDGRTGERHYNHAVNPNTCTRFTEAYVDPLFQVAEPKVVPQHGVEQQPAARRGLPGRRPGSQSR